MRDRNTSRIVLYHIAEILSYFHPNHPSRDPAPTITAYDEMQSFFPKQASKDSKSTLYILPFVPSHHGNSIRHPASQLHSRDCTHPPHHIAKTNITARDAIGITGKSISITLRFMFGVEVLCVNKITSSFQNKPIVS